MLNSSWLSSNSQIDYKNGRISFLYDVSSSEGIPQDKGIAVFDFQRLNANSRPTNLVGYPSDLEYGKKIMSLETKISDKYDRNINYLKKAIDFANENEWALKAKTIKP